METNIELGKRVDTGAKVFLDLLKLIATRLLICANSGGGKSYLIRRICELAFGKIPVIIIDPEGEFASLREQFDFVLVGKGGEAATDCRSAKLLIHKLLELRASAVIDLSEMELPERHRYVRLLAEAAINSPKQFWQPTIFVFDEVHTFAPANGKGESEAKNAVIAFPTRGRKRQFISIFATQRLHKLDMDARAEFLNRMIGMTFEPDDLKAAAGILGVSGKEETKEFNHRMRTMEAGIFYAFGRAISLETIQVKIGTVKTSHDIATAKFGATPPPTPAKVKKLLPQLADLPKEAAEKEQSEDNLRAEIKRLIHELEAAKRAAPPAPKPLEVPMLSPDELKRIQDLTEKIDLLMKEFSFDQIAGQLGGLLGEASNIRGIIQERKNAAKEYICHVPQPKIVIPKDIILNVLKERGASEVRTGEKKLAGVAQDGSPSSGLRRIMVALAQTGRSLTIKKVAVHAGMSKSSGTFTTYISSARAMEWVTGSKEGLEITKPGIEILGQYEPLPTGEALFRHWLGKLGSGGVPKILETLFACYPKEMSKEELANQIGMSPKSGTYTTYLSTLRNLDLITGKSSLKASEDFF